MKFKKAIAAMLALAMLGSVAYAADVRVSVSGTTVTLGAQTVLEEDEAGVNVNILVARKGEDINDDANVYEMIQVETDAEGNIYHSFTLPYERGGVSSYGEYDVFIKPAGKDMITGEFSFVTEDDILALMTAILADGANFAAIFDADSEYRTSLKAIGCVMDKYDALGAPANVATLFAGALTQDADETDVKAIFNTAVLATAITNATTADEYLDVYTPHFVDKEYIEMEDKQKEWISETLPAYAPFESVADFEEKYERVNIFYEINTAKFDKLEEVLGDYDDKLGIEDDADYRDYLSITPAKRMNANEDIAADLKRNPVSTADALLGVIREAVKEAKKGSGSGGGSGSGSGGGSGTGIIAPGPAEITPTNKPADSMSTNFTDLDQVAWAKDAILALRDKGIVSGVGAGLFAPFEPVTREAFTTMIVNATGLYKPGETVVFDDVTPSDWCYSYVASAFNNKLVYGISETSFGKGMNISRQDMAVIAYRAAKDSGRIHVGREMETFKDHGQISEYALEAIEALYKTGVVNGSDGYYNPLATATRAEASVIIYNLFVK